MKALDNLKETKIKRKNFLYLTGLFAAGAFVFSRVPINLFRKRTGKEAPVRQGIKPVPNPEAVKRITEDSKKTKGV